ncbi:SPFH domain-containing protein [Corynebacterium camporealensis]|uniref:SPFH domain-containing protein n=1 Tax=Corynebacterium camporealensis TaxID=161896 RepID=UPI0026799E8A
MQGFIVVVIILVLIVMTLFDGYFTVRTREAAILERLGKFTKVAHAGLHFKVPFIDRVRDKISLQVRQLDVMVETKTKDNVFVQIPVAVQYEVVEGREREAYYMLSNHEQQIIAYVQDNVRSSVANMDLDDSFSSKDTIARNVAISLRDNMAEYGWNFVNTLVTDIRPDSRVRESMNSINAAQREREAAVAQAEAEKIRVVKEAEGAAEARKLQGRGVAEQRKEIVEGIAAQYEMLRKAGVEESPEASCWSPSTSMPWSMSLPTATPASSTCPPTQPVWAIFSTACVTCSWPTTRSGRARDRRATTTTAPVTSAKNLQAARRTTSRCSAPWSSRRIAMHSTTQNPRGAICQTAWETTSSSCASSSARTKTRIS